jgi:hypothetical protein
MPKPVFDDHDEDDAADLWDGRPHARVRSRPLPWLRMAALSCAIVAGLAYLARHAETEAPSDNPKAIPASVLVAPAPVWKPVASSRPLFGIEKSTAPVASEAREHASGGREDTLVLGSFGRPGHGRISLIQGFTEPVRTFYVDLVRRAAAAGLSVNRTSQSQLLRTKFGPVEAAAVTLAGATEQNCLAFRFEDPQASFGFQGWLCGLSPQAVDETQAACLIERIALVSEDNPSVRAVFARAERNRTEACSPGARTASIGVRSTDQP